MCRVIHQRITFSNIFDLRQFLYNTKWPYQFQKIEDLVHDLDVEKGQKVKMREDSSDHHKLKTNGDVHDSVWFDLYKFIHTNGYRIEKKLKVTN